MKKLSVVILVALLLAACSKQPVPELAAEAASWQKLGGTLDFTADKTPHGAQLLLDKTEKPVVASLEEDAKGGRKLVLQTWTPTGWQNFATPLAVPTGGHSLFDVGIDAQNRPVVLIGAGTTSRGNPTLEDGAVYRFDGSWKRLGEPFDYSDLAVAPNGTIYTLLNSYNRYGENQKSQIRRWNGSAWQTDYTFQKITTTDYAGYSLFSPISHGAASLTFTSTNKPVVTWLLTIDEWGYSASPLTQVAAWNGSSWTAKGDFWGEMMLDKTNNLVTAAVDAQFSSSISCGLGVAQGTTYLSELADATMSSTYKLAVDANNRPIVAYSVRCNQGEYGGTDVEEAKQDLVVKRWSGNSWQALGGAVDRIANKGAWGLGVAADSKNTVYVLFEQCVASTGMTCTNKNLYVSKYIP